MVELAKGASTTSANTCGSRRTAPDQRPIPDPTSPLGVLELCRGLLAYTAPESSVTIPRAALAELVELASGTSSTSSERNSTSEPLPTLFNVASLAARYDRAPPTVRQWFHDGLFGPPKERLFRGRGYVASSEAVLEFEERTGLRPAAGAPNTLPSACGDGRPTSVSPNSPRQKRATGSLSRIGKKILAAQQRPGNR